MLARILVLLTVAGVGIACPVEAQTNKYRWMGSFSGSFIDYRGLIDRDITQINTYAPGISLGGYGYVSNWMNASLSSIFVPEVRFPIGPQESITSSLVDVSVTAQIKSNGSILKEDAFLAPYLVTGFGFNIASSRTGIYVPAGLGVRIRITDAFSFQLESMYKQRLNNEYQHLQHSVGLVFAVSQPRHERKPTPAPPAPKNTTPQITKNGDAKPGSAGDRDGDGIPDKEDICPDEKGLALYMGCPDRKRQTEAATLPRDPSTVEKTPLQKPAPEELPARQESSPHIVDLAPQRKATPVSRSESAPLDLTLLEGAMQKIYFDEQSISLRQDAFQILDQVAAIMHRYPDYHLEVLGHTDNQGDAKDKLVTSIQRAFNVKYYLVHEKGIKLSRISSDGYSDLAPDGDNGSAEGRSLNRRVEFRLIKLPSSSN